VNSFVQVKKLFSQNFPMSILTLQIFHFDLIGMNNKNCFVKVPNRLVAATT
jgi:hypothetical protein